MVTHILGIRFHWITVILLISGLVVLGVALAALSHSPDPQLILQADRAEIPAGNGAVHFTIRSSIPLAIRLPSSGLEAAIAEGAHSARVSRTYFSDAVWHVIVQSKAMPGKVKVVATMPPFVAGSEVVTVVANERDSFGDGTPDVLRLDDPSDAAAFRSWFTFLAEAQFFRETASLPAEIADCAGLIRYAYREALLAHDSAWAKASRLPLVPAIGSVRKYEYPYTPWGTGLFRTGSGTVAEFADAGNLLRYNTHFVSRDLRLARPGDLIFFHQDEAAMPYHSMIYLGASQVENAAGPFVIYHTGPAEARPTKGEIRRPSVEELQKHPDPGWHPVTENPHYLGVYRWNVLRQ